MKITRRDPISGITNTMDLDITTTNIIEWEKGALIQDAMPHLSADEREFLMTGIMPDSWDEAFGEEED